MRFWFGHHLNGINILLLTFTWWARPLLPWEQRSPGGAVLQPREDSTVLAGMARAAQQPLSSIPRWVCRFWSISRTISRPPADPSSGCISQTIQTLLYRLVLLQSHDKMHVQEPEAIPATDLLLDVQQVTLPHCISAPSLTKSGCDRGPLTWRRH